MAYPRWARGWVISGLILVGLVVAYCYGRECRYVPDSPEPLPFDRSLWLAGKARHRAGMAYYLADRKALDGLTRAELVEMLGEPDEEKRGDEGTRWFLGRISKGLFDETLWLELTMKGDGTAFGAVVGVSWAPRLGGER
jgi:hypothetical protein